MTKREMRWAVRTSPIGQAGIERIKRIVDEKQGAKVNECFVDLWSASVVSQVWDALNDVNREKFVKLPVAQACALAFRCTSKKGE
jgi:hypothetical protein